MIAYHRWCAQYKIFFDEEGVKYNHSAIYFPTSWMSKLVLKGETTLRTPMSDRKELCLSNIVVKPSNGGNQMYFLTYFCLYENEKKTVVTNSLWLFTHLSPFFDDILKTHKWWQEPEQARRFTHITTDVRGFFFYEGVESINLPSWILRDVTRSLSPRRRRYYWTDWLAFLSLNISGLRLCTPFARGYKLLYFPMSSNQFHLRRRRDKYTGVELTNSGIVPWTHTLWVFLISANVVLLTDALVRAATAPLANLPSISKSAWIRAYKNFRGSMSHSVLLPKVLVSWR